jgi:Peptide N-acetyl-beta-D-glucosaminyl asparaginase amidase A
MGWRESQLDGYFERGKDSFALFRLTPGVRPTCRPNLIGSVPFRSIMSKVRQCYNSFVYISELTFQVWRTSTPEPSLNGIIWTFLKDVSRYVPLFAKPGTLILDLDNIVEPGLTGQYDGCGSLG